MADEQVNHLCESCQCKCKQTTTVEVIMAKALDMNVLGLTLAANESGAADVTHDSVRAAAEAHSEDFERLVRGVLRML